MGLGVLEQSHLERVPGTVFLNEDGVHGSVLPGKIQQDTEFVVGLKHQNNIVLVPQVSTSNEMTELRRR